MTLRSVEKIKRSYTFIVVGFSLFGIMAIAGVVIGVFAVRDLVGYYLRPWDPFFAVKIMSRETARLLGTISGGLFGVGVAGVAIAARRMVLNIRRLEELAMKLDRLGTVPGPDE